MARDNWQIVRLQRAHRRDTFDCGSSELNEYIRKFARQNDQKGIGRVYVAVYPDEMIVRGYYTLSTSAVEHKTMPEAARKKLPRYPVPTALLGRLAVDESAKGLGLGRELLMDALHRILTASEEVGIHAVEVDAKNRGARAFYAKYGFEPLLDDERHMFISIKAVRKAFL